MGPIYYILIALPCTVGAMTLAILHIHKHLLNYTEPTYQRYIVRIIFMVSVYALMSFLSLVLNKGAIYFNSFREVKSEIAEETRKKLEERKKSRGREEYQLSAANQRTGVVASDQDSAGPKSLPHRPKSSTRRPMSVMACEVSTPGESESHGNCPAPPGRLVGG